MVKKVLVIDDDRDILEAIMLILSTEGYKTEGVAKGDEVYPMTQKFKPDLIVLDILLSGNDGRSICIRLKHDNATKHIPVIMISAHPSAKDSVKDCGADAFIPKPFSLNDLVSQVESFIGKP